VTTATARLRAPAEAAGDRSRPPLRLVRHRPTMASRAPFIVLIGGILTGGLVALLLLHTMAAQDAFRLHDLQRQAAALADTQQELAVTTQHLESPSGLAARARSLGMVPTGSISFVRLRSGRLVGVAHAAPAPAPTTASPSSSTSSSTKTSTTSRTAHADPGASSRRAGAKPAGCSHAHCRTARHP
jgi:hypothetical protein